jgi:hypothetical protein
LAFSLILFIKSGVIAPVSLFSTITLAPNASIDCCLLFENASENTATNFNANTVDTKAKDVPVLPPVYSTTVSPWLISPRSMALPKTDTAIRSLYDPVGLALSSFIQTSAEFLGTMLFNLTSGVLPIPVREVFLICMRFLLRDFYIVVVQAQWNSK